MKLDIYAIEIRKGIFCNGIDRLVSTLVFMDLA